jgi:hypothetical protein
MQRFATPPMLVRIQPQPPIPGLIDPVIQIIDSMISLCLSADSIHLAEIGIQQMLKTKTPPKRGNNKSFMSS